MIVHLSEGCIPVWHLSIDSSNVILDESFMTPILVFGKPLIVANIGLKLSFYGLVMIHGEFFVGGKSGECRIPFEFLVQTTVPLNAFGIILIDASLVIGPVDYQTILTDGAWSQTPSPLFGVFVTYATKVIEARNKIGLNIWVLVNDSLYIEKEGYARGLISIKLEYPRLLT